MGKSEGESLYVQAESWQKALQGARAQRGESAPMSGFSIELLDEGCRAVDPMSRRRYEVRRAADDAAASRTERPPPPPVSISPPRPATSASPSTAPPAAT